MERIDVLLPIHKSNYSYLREAVESINNQSHPTRLICILNGMNDVENSEYTSFLSCLGVGKILVSPTRGVAAALNYAAPFIQSAYVGRQDDDDISHPDRIRIQVEAIRSSSAHVMGTAIIEINEEGRIIGQKQYPRYHRKCIETLSYKTCFCHPSVIMDSSILFDHSYPLIGSEDYAMWLSLRNLYKFENCPHPLYRYRRHSRQTSKNNIPYIFICESLSIICESSLLSRPMLLLLLIIHIANCVYKGRSVMVRLPKNIHN